MSLYCGRRRKAARVTSQFRRRSASERVAPLFLGKQPGRHGRVSGSALLCRKPLLGTCSAHYRSQALRLDAPRQKRGDAEFYWGYASGVVATIVPDLGEVVLAERTRPFNESDISYFWPLIHQTEQRLGRQPRFGAWDAAFDAHYVYDYFHDAGGFAAVPLVVNPRHGVRQFSPDGRPCCAAGLPMPRLFLYQDRTSGLLPHTREKCGCPLLVPTSTGAPCPIADAHFAKGGCTTSLAASVGARIRWQLDRASPDYLAIFNQRTVCERVNSQAVELGIERPKLRNQRSIANQNTLLYVLLNLQTLQRIQTRQVAQAEAGPGTTDVALVA